jgi:hypothetical protein
MTREIEKLLADAIADHRCVTLGYEGDEGEQRMVMPHAIFRNASGAALLHAFQVRGHASGGSPTGWKDFALARIAQAETSTEEFKLHDGFDPSSRRFEHGLLVYIRP